jgi:LacI family transcriptional regulator
MVGQIAFEHFRALGLTRFAYLPWPSSPDNSERQDGFMEAVHKVKMANRVTVLRTWLSTSNWHHDLKEKAKEFQKLTFPIGVFAFSDWLAALASHALRVAQIDVPGEVALLGVGDDEMTCEGCNPAISSVDCNLERVGFEAAVLLDRIIRNGSMPARPTLITPRGVIERTSTQILAVEDDDVAAALRIIQSRHAAQAPPTADEVASAVLVSSRSLDAKFKQQIGRSISDEISRRQLMSALALLDHSELSPRDIAVRCGFKTINHFSFVVSKHTGLPPVAYRRSNRNGYTR